MALTRKQRQQVWDRSRGHCWYCGCPLPDKGWHADHAEPVIRNDYAIAIQKKQAERDSKMLGRIVSPSYEIPEMEKPDRDHIDNIVPACAPCNLFKSTFSIEQFRLEVEAQIERARKTSVNFRTAERFGLVESKPQKVEFWFERQGL